ncbi:MAG: GNAT family N-acetyltransferase [Fimbriimonadaceae bacterium]
MIHFRQMAPADIPGVVDLQRACFPPPFPEELLWQAEHIARHLEIFPEGQFVALHEGMVIGSASACLISEDAWQSHLPWEETLGGYFFDHFDAQGSTLYGADVSVNPEFRGRGVGRGLYQCRYDFVRDSGLLRYGTACRIPDFRGWFGQDSASRADLEEYCRLVEMGKLSDRTLSPLLRYGLRREGVIENYIEDIESANAACVLVWEPGQ